MINYTTQDYINGVNAAFKVNEKALYEAIDNGTFSEFTIGETKQCYKYSNRELLVNQMFERVPTDMNRTVQTITKGYAVNQISVKANEYIFSKRTVIKEVDSAVRIAELEAQVAKLKAESKEAHLYTVQLEAKVSRLESAISKIRTINLNGVITKVAVFTGIKQSV